MNKMYLATYLSIFMIMGVNTTYAQVAPTTVQVDLTATPVEAWTSHTVHDYITIENGTGDSLSILIKVDNNDEANASGIYIQNCGNTFHVAANGTAICITNNSKSPVTFHSDSDKPATGTYQVTHHMRH